MHLDLLSTTSFTDLTTPTSSIERESPWAKSSLLCIERGCIYFTNIGKYSCVCGDIGMWCFAYRRLIDDDHLVDVRHTFDTLMSTNGESTFVEVIEEFLR